MSASYKKLWKLLIDRGLKKRDICNLAKVSSASMAKMGKNENVSMETLFKICKTLNCDLKDIIEYIPESSQATVLSEEVKAN